MVEIKVRRNRCGRLAFAVFSLLFSWSVVSDARADDYSVSIEARAPTPAGSPVTFGIVFNPQIFCTTVC